MQQLASHSSVLAQFRVHHLARKVRTNKLKSNSRALSNISNRLSVQNVYTPLQSSHLYVCSETPPTLLEYTHDFVIRGVTKLRMRSHMDRVFAILWNIINVIKLHDR